jgi:O-antigen/teichoic acid export membrane protein
MGSDESMVTHAETDTVRRTFRALSWSYGLTLVRNLLAFGLSIILARVLGPTPYGAVAAGLLVVGIGLIVVDAGAGAALIQRTDVDGDVIASVFTWQLFVGGLLTVVVFSTAHPISALFGGGRNTETAIRALSFMFLFQAGGLASTALLRRELRHARVLAGTTITYAFAYGLLGIPLALRGAGVWSLVTAQLVQCALASVVTYAAVRHSLRLRWPWRDTQIVQFGMKVTGVNAVNWLIENGDNLVVGAALGTRQLGLYSRAYSTLRWPTDALTQSAQAVAFAAFSRRGAGAATTRAYKAAINAISLAVIPLFLVVAVSGHSLIQALYGDEWLAAVPLVWIFSAAMIFQCLVAITGSILWAINSVGSELRAQLAVIALGGLALAFFHSTMTAVASVVLSTYILRAILMLRALQKKLDMPKFGILLVMASGLRPGLLALGSAIALQYVIRQDPWLSLSLSLLSGFVCVFTAVIWASPIEVQADLGRALLVSGMPLPPRIRSRRGAPTPHTHANSGTSTENAWPE